MARISKTDHGDQKVVSVTFVHSGFKFSSLGATWQSWSVTDNSGKRNELLCGFKDPEDYLLPENPYFGATVGRIAGRVKNARVHVNGCDLQLKGNENNKTLLHGGQDGLTFKNFSVVAASQRENGSVAVTFEYTSKDGEAGLPANVRVRVTYTVSEPSANKSLIEIRFDAENLGPQDETLVSLTNHAYFNVSPNGSEKESIAGSKLKLASAYVLEMDSEHCTTGGIVQHENIPTDASGEPIEFELEAAAGKTTFDDHMVLDQKQMNDRSGQLDTTNLNLKQFAQLSHPGSGIKLTGSTTEPTVTFYTGEYINVKQHKGRAGLAFEPSRPSGSAVHDKWRHWVLLSKGDHYGAKSMYTVSIS